MKHATTEGDTSSLGLRLEVEAPKKRGRKPKPVEPIELARFVVARGHRARVSHLAEVGPVGELSRLTTGEVELVPEGEAGDLVAVCGATVQAGPRGLVGRAANAGAAPSCEACRRRWVASGCVGGGEEPEPERSEPELAPYVPRSVREAAELEAVRSRFPVGSRPWLRGSFVRHENGMETGRRLLVEGIGVLDAAGGAVVVYVSEDEQPGTRALGPGLLVAESEVVAPGGDAAEGTDGTGTALCHANELGSLGETTAQVTIDILPGGRCAKEVPSEPAEESTGAPWRAPRELPEPGPCSVCGAEGETERRTCLDCGEVFCEPCAKLPSSACACPELGPEDGPAAPCGACGDPSGHRPGCVVASLPAVGRVVFHVKNETHLPIQVQGSAFFTAPVRSEPEACEVAALREATEELGRALDAERTELATVRQAWARMDLERAREAEGAARERRERILAEAAREQALRAAELLRCSVAYRVGLRASGYAEESDDCFLCSVDARGRHQRHCELGELYGWQDPPAKHEAAEGAQRTYEAPAPLPFGAVSEGNGTEGRQAGDSRVTNGVSQAGGGSGLDLADSAQKKNHCAREVPTGGTGSTGGRALAGVRWDAVRGVVGLGVPVPVVAVVVRSLPDAELVDLARAAFGGAS